MCIHVLYYAYVTGLNVMHRYSTTTSASGASPRTVRLIVHRRSPRPWLLHTCDPNNTAFRFHIRTVRGVREALQP